jgi:hypothetical protein
MFTAVDADETIRLFYILEIGVAMLGYCARSAIFTMRICLSYSVQKPFGIGHFTHTMPQI